MLWNVQRLHEQFGEDVLRDITRDVNDLMCGIAGRGWKVNRIGIPEAIWRKLLRRGGYGDEGIERALRAEELFQKDAIGPFSPYTIHTLVNITDDNGGPLTREEFDTVLRAALRYRQLITE